MEKKISGTYEEGKGTITRKCRNGKRTLNVNKFLREKDRFSVGKGEYTFLTIEMTLELLCTPLHSDRFFMLSGCEDEHKVRADQGQAHQPEEHRHHQAEGTYTLSSFQIGLQLQTNREIWTYFHIFNHHH
jgi:hypothetical protein